MWLWAFICSVHILGHNSPMNVPHHVEVDIQTLESGHVWKFYLIGGLKKLCFFLLTHWSLGDLDAILKTAISNLVLLIGFFISSNDNAPR